MTDTDFRAEAEKLKVDVDPVHAEQLTKIVEEVLDTPADLAQRAKAILASVFTPE